MGTKGTVASTAALAVLLQEGIGDTIRVSLTPEPGGARTQEVVVALEAPARAGAIPPADSTCSPAASRSLLWSRSSVRRR